jgi:glutathione synthase/RimK-type ligase-like ATP-grasp enzyme
MNNSTEKTILLLTDYRNTFYSTTRPKETGMDINILKDKFNEKGYHLIVKGFCEIDFANPLNEAKYVLYQSSEDRDLFYKSFIEDIILGLQLKGATLIPDFYKFRAHHNKVFMEILRQLNSSDQVKSCNAKAYGTYEEFLTNNINSENGLVIKAASGTGSRGVRLAKNKDAALKIAKSISRSFNLQDFSKNLIKTIIRPYHKKQSNNRKKFIAQEFIPGLTNDYKILVFNDKYYVLYRRNRKNDFRASGGGLFEWKENIPSALLDFAKHVYQSFDVPFISMDIAFTQERCYLIEFQFLMFGPYTLEKSAFYFKWENDKWNIIREKSDLENEFSSSVVMYIENSINVLNKA